MNAAEGPWGEWGNRTPSAPLPNNIKTKVNLNLNIINIFSKNNDNKNKTKQQTQRVKLTPRSTKSKASSQAPSRGNPEVSNTANCRARLELEQLFWLSVSEARSL